MSGFWDWALAAYDRPGVAEACLDLQDNFQRNTAFLLWSAWAAGEGRAPDAAALAEMATVARAWEGEVLGPLRAARRGLKPERASIDPAARLALREEVKAVELAAERLLMETLATHAGGVAEAVKPLDAMRAAAASWGGPACDAALARLAARIS